MRSQDFYKCVGKSETKAEFEDACGRGYIRPRGGISAAAGRIASPDGL